MKARFLKGTLVLAAATFLSLSASADGKRQYTGPYSGENLNHVAFPIGGLGSGMFCLEGTGNISHMSPRHYPEVFHEPCTFAAIHVKGLKNGTKVLEGNVPEWKKFGDNDTGLGKGGTTWGLPRFSDCEFSSRFPFATIKLHDDEMPVDVVLTAFNPFIPNDEDNSGLPVGVFEYQFTNTSDKAIETVFSFNTRNFMFRTHDALSEIVPMKNGFVLRQEGTKAEPWINGEFAIFTDNDEAVVNHTWFRGGWFDPLTMAWNDLTTGELKSVSPKPGAPGATLFVPVALKAGESKTVKVFMAWYNPDSMHRIGPDAVDDNDLGDRYSPDLYKDTPNTYRPWYATRFKNTQEVAKYWLDNYQTLRERTVKFTEAFYDSTLPAEVIEAVAANLTILKSTTVMRQHDGRMWNWEGSGDTWGSCHGSCTHVWNYAQAICHLFPRMERTLRETEFKVSQNKDGHQAFRTNIPIRPVHHDFHSASDGQLGGIMKVYRDWRISGDDAWIADLWPLIQKSMDYCIRTWDPKEVGALEEPHHNTYDIEFWGPDGMCTSFYAGALNATIEMGTYLKKDVKRYKALLAKCQDYMETKLFNGEYFYQQVRWKDLQATDPTSAQMFHAGYSDEAVVILEKEGPKYQYGTGCISDGVLGCWMSLTAGLQEPISSEKVRSHLNSVYAYNLKHDLSDHANPQRPTYALGHDGGLLLCTWPRGGKPQLPFVYSDEVWTGIEYQVASHLIFEGEVEKGLDIVRTCRDRYDGRIRNPFNEYECGSWYARAMSSYGLLQALTGVRYDAVTKTLYIDSKVGDFRSFLSTNSGYATVSLEGGKPSIKMIEGDIDVQNCIVSGKKAKLSK
ncbi:MAG: hypothetical protein HUJ94_01935 [Bacteroidales bacterium]|nr:hypothetical protein [Bacteroidales bacterium]